MADRERHKRRKKGATTSSLGTLRISRSSRYSLSRLYGDVEKPSVGLALSGGSLRSAMFGSGVLRHLLHEGTRLDFLSSVGGGSFVAASYMDWKFREGGTDHSAWHKRYFEHIVGSASEVMFRFEQGLRRGLVDVAVNVGLPLFNGVVVTPILLLRWCLVVSLAIDMGFGNVIRRTYDLEVATNSFLGLSCPLVLMVVSFLLTLIRGKFHKSGAPSLLDHAMSTLLVQLGFLSSIVAEVCLLALYRNFADCKEGNENWLSTTIAYFAFQSLYISASLPVYRFTVSICKS